MANLGDLLPLHAVSDCQTLSGKPAQKKGNNINNDNPTKFSCATGKLVLVSQTGFISLNYAFGAIG